MFCEATITQNAHLLSHKMGNNCYELVSWPPRVYILEKSYSGYATYLLSCLGRPVVVSRLIFNMFKNSYRWAEASEWPE